MAKKKAAQSKSRTVKKTTSRSTKSTAKKKSAAKKSVKKAVTKKAKATQSKKKTSTTKKTTPTKSKTARTKTATKKVTKKKAKKPATKAKSTSAHSWTPPAPKEPLEEQIPQPLSQAQLRKVKSGLSRKEIEDYRQLLLHKHAEIIGDVTAMQNDACNKNSDGNLSHMPVHMADIGSDNYEQEFTLGLVESERRLLHEIELALERINNKVYGVCEVSGVPIGKPRLDAKPWARFCIAVARERERLGVRM